MVDNSSRDEPCELLREVSDVHLIEQRNTGYADGLNRGIAEAPAGHDILVLNPDVVLQPAAWRDRPAVGRIG